MHDFGMKLLFYANIKKHNFNNLDNLEALHNVYT